MLRRRASETLVSYEREVDKGKLTAHSGFEKLAQGGDVSRACALRRSKPLLRRWAHARAKRLRSASAFQNRYGG